MSVTEGQRHHLYESLKAHLGAAGAETFMNLVPPFDWSEIATKADIARLQAATKADVARLEAATKADVARLEAATKADIARLEAATKADIAELRADVIVIKADLLRTFGTWLFASQAGVVASVALLVGFLG